MKLSEYLKILQGFMDTYGDMEVYEEREGGRGEGIEYMIEANGPRLCSVGKCGRGGCSGLHPGAIWSDRPLEAGQTYSVRIT